jgi:hypothetical protein
MLRALAYHDRDWRRLPWRGSSEPHPGPFPRPERYEELLSVAERLVAGSIMCASTSTTPTTTFMSAS